MAKLRELSRLARHLRENVSDRDWRFSVWLRRRETGCGTVGCAIGHGITAFADWREQGFKLSNSEYLSIPIYKRENYWSAIAAFFEISESQAQRLFSPNWHPNGYNATREQVADLIETFVTNSEKASVLD